MFLSKIWFFLVGVAAATALTIALLLPRPSERQQAAEEKQRVTTACDVVNILLRTNARSRVDLADKFARSELDLAGILNLANGKKEVSDDAYKKGRTAASKLLESTTGAKPTFIILVDAKGRVVARLGIDDKIRGDTLAGYYLVDDVLAGYLRDDLWIIDNELFLVAGAPVIRGNYAGAVIIGHRMNKEFAEQFVQQLGVDVNFYADGQLMAASNAVPIHKKVQAQYVKVSSTEEPLADDCRTFKPFLVDLGSEAYTALLARLPGEASDRGAFFSVFVKRPGSLGLMGTLSTVKQDDMSFGNFPWITLGIGLILILAVGMALMIFEADLPLRKLSGAAVKLAKGEQERFDEEAHRSKFGSIARSVNIRLDKIEREAKAKKTDLDDLLGSSASALPLAGPGGFSRPSKPPPPSEFKFTGNQPRAATPPPAKPQRAATPPPRAATPPPAIPGRANTPPPLPGAGPAAEPPPLEPAPADDAEPAAAAAAEPTDDEAAFRKVFQDFLRTKKECGESTSNLTFEKFAIKLRKNRETLMSKHKCTAVKFQVYVKDGKAALKATPVK